MFGQINGMLDWQRPQLLLINVDHLILTEYLGRAEHRALD